jgi:hypothetical protein
MCGPSFPRKGPALGVGLLNRGRLMSADDDYTSSGPKAAQNARYGRCGAR